VRRRFLNAAAAVSLLSCFAVVWLWARSYRALDELYGTGSGRYFIIDSANGSVTFDVRRRYLARPGADESRMLRDQRSPRFDLLMDGASANDYKTEVVRMRWPLSETDRSVESPALFPAASWDRYLTWARSGHRIRTTSVL
jgi:hypothetical protein